MIKLAFLVACEKLIVGQDNNTSLISVLEHIQLNVQPPDDLPDNAAIPFKWSAIALWHRTEQLPEPIAYEGKFELFNPASTVYMGGDAKFTVSNQHVNFRSIVDFPAFPMKIEGTYWLKVSYRKDGVGDFQIAGEFPIQLRHIQEALNAEAVTSEVEPAIG